MPTTTFPPFSGLYAFVRQHLAVVNGLVLAAGTLVSVLDFFAPAFPLLQRLVYVVTGLGVVALLSVAIFPKILRPLTGRTSLVWRKPAWQLALLFLGCITLVGAASLAKASHGGLISSSFAPVKSLQDRLLSVHMGVASLQSDMTNAHAKLDRIVSAVATKTGAPGCTELGCAVIQGAPAAEVQKMFARGATLPGKAALDGVLLLDAALPPRESRFAVLNVLADQGLDLNMRLIPRLSRMSQLTPNALAVALAIEDRVNLQFSPDAGKQSSRLDLPLWNATAACLDHSSNGVTLLELAGMLGDTNLQAYLVQRGLSPPSRPLACSWRTGYARVELDAASATYLKVSSR